MDLARIVYSRGLKLVAMRAMDAGKTSSEVARRLELSPRLLEKWRLEWRARGEAAFPGRGNRNSGGPVSDERRLAELERKIGQLTVENDSSKKALTHFREHHPPAVVNGGPACTEKSKKPPKQEGL
jgi:transposase-like protein